MQLFAPPSSLLGMVEASDNLGWCDVQSTAPIRADPRHSSICQGVLSSLGARDVERQDGEIVQLPSGIPDVVA